MHSSSTQRQTSTILNKLKLKPTCGAEDDYTVFEISISQIKVNRFINLSFSFALQNTSTQLQLLNFTFTLIP